MFADSLDSSGIWLIYGKTGSKGSELNWWRLVVDFAYPRQAHDDYQVNHGSSYRRENFGMLLEE